MSTYMYKRNIKVSSSRYLRPHFAWRADAPNVSRAVTHHRHVLRRRASVIRAQPLPVAIPEPIDRRRYLGALLFLCYHYSRTSFRIRIIDNMNILLRRVISILNRLSS